MRKCIFIFLICHLTNTVKSQQIESSLLLNSVMFSLDYISSVDVKNKLSNSVEEITLAEKTNSKKDNLAFEETNEKLAKKKKHIVYKEINGFIINSHSNIPISDATLKVFYDTEEVYDTFKTDDEGFFEFEVPIKTQLFIEAKHENFNLRYKKVVYFDVKKSDFFKIYLIPLSKKKKPVIEEVVLKYNEIDLKDIAVKSRKGKLILDMPELFFDIDEADLAGKDNNKILNKIIKILVDNPDLVLEISSHTDSRGPKNYLIDLSNRRAESVRIFLAKKGIEGNRVEVKGNGSSSLLNDCKKDEKCSEKQHQLNKRTEFVVLNPVTSKK